ncbi:retrovirus-related pol polyprotein from transposon TNT 1-94 [Tanacetum coccineum]
MAFTASSTIPAIYIQQFWDTIDAPDITPTNDDNPFVAPPSSDTVLEYVNTLGYPSTLRNVSAMSVNALYQPWRAILSMINMCLTGKTAGYDRPRHPVLQILWASRGNKKTPHLLIPNVMFTKLIIHHLKTKHDIHPRTGSALHYSHEENVLNTLRYIRKDGREIFGMPIPDTLLTDTIKRAPYYNGYLEHVAEYQCYLDEEHDKADDKTPKPTSSQPSKPTPTPTKPSQKDQGKKRKLVKETSDAPSSAKRSKACKVTKKRIAKSPLKLVDEPSDEGVRVKESAYNEEEANLQRALELSLKEQGEQTQGLACPIVLREHDSRRIQPLSDVQGMGKEKRRTPMPTETSRHAESPSLDVELALTDSETESNNEVPKINTGDQDEGQAGPNPGERTLSSLQNLEKDLSFTYQFFVEKPQEEELGKTNAATEVQSMVLVPIHQDTSSIPSMTTPVIDLTKSQSNSPLPTSTTTISTIMTTITTLLPPPPQPQQSTADLILVKHIGELEQHMADLIQNNLAMEERDLPTVDMKEILQQRMFEDNSYKAYDVHNDLYEALHKSLELDYSNQHLANQEEARKKRRQRRDVPRTPSGSLPLQPPPPASISSAPVKVSKALSSSKTAASASQSMAWTTSDTRYESASVFGDQELSPTDSMMQDDSITDEQVHLSDEEDSGNDHLLKADSRKDWWKPLPEEERPATPKPAWIIPSSNVSAIENNWASVLVSTYETPAKNSLLAKTGDMTSFINCYCQKMNKTELTQADFEGHAYEVVKAFYPDVIHL